MKVEKEESAILDGLQTGTVYVLRVLGYSIGGDGSLSPHVYFTVEGKLLTTIWPCIFLSLIWISLVA